MDDIRADDENAIWPLFVRYGREEWPQFAVGALALDRGTAIDTANDEGTDAADGGYSYLWIYRRSADEEWELTHLIWNSTD